jgi:hypothetical protein
LLLTAEVTFAQSKIWSLLKKETLTRLRLQQGRTKLRLQPTYGFFKMSSFLYNKLDKLAAFEGAKMNKDLTHPCLQRGCTKLQL